MYVAIQLATSPPFEGLPDFYTPLEQIPGFHPLYAQEAGAYAPTFGRAEISLKLGPVEATKAHFGVGLFETRPRYMDDLPAQGALLSVYHQPEAEVCEPIYDQLFQRYGAPIRGAVSTTWDGLIVELHRYYAAGCWYQLDVRSPEEDTFRQGSLLDPRPTTKHPKIPPEVRPTYVEAWHKGGQRAFLGATLSDVDRLVENTELPPLWRDHLSRSLRTFVAQRQAWGRFEQSGMVAEWEKTWKKP